MTTRWNLLTEPLFTVDTPDGERSFQSLPWVLHSLAGEHPLEFGALQAHQIQSWESFLIQLGALVVNASGGDLPPTEVAWRAALRSLAGGDDCAWCLVVDDIARPAFMQPPIAGKDFRDSKEAARASDALDRLITSKNLDVKLARALRSRAEHWAFSLVSLQTSSAYSGPRLYGVSRMNGGSSSRPSLGSTTGISMAARFVRDITVWNERRASIASAFGMRSDGGQALLWVVPWDGTTQLSLSQLDPCFIEVCRLVRLGVDERGTYASGGTTDAMRIDAKALHGDIGDIWVPVRRGEQRAAFTASADGFGYRTLTDLLFGDAWDRAAAIEPRPGESHGVALLARVMTGGNCTTDGLHERVIPIPGRARSVVFGSKATRTSVAKMAQERVGDVARVQSKVLHPALCALLQAVSPDQKLDLKDERTQRWRHAHDERIDASFFGALWADAEVVASDPNEATRRWHAHIVAVARYVWREALDSVPLPSVRAWRARAVGERVFEGSARKHFPMAFQPAPSDAAKEINP